MLDYADTVHVLGALVAAAAPEVVVDIEAPSMV